MGAVGGLPWNTTVPEMLVPAANVGRVTIVASMNVERPWVVILGTLNPWV